MEPIVNAPNTTKAIEVLFFEEAEVMKMKAGQPSFATFGPMSVIYCPSYNRFLLQINDWRYPLLRRLSATSSGSGSYTLPGPNGSSFDLKITKPGQALGNLDALLEGTRKLESSPDDKLVRMHKKMHTETGPKEVISQTIKQAVHKVQNKIATAKTGTKHLTSTKKRINMKDIKTKDFKKESHSKIKKSFFESSEKLTAEFTQRRRENINLTQSKQFDDLKKTSASHAAVFHIPQLEIEEAILNMKEISEAPKVQGVMGRERAVPEVQGHVEKTLISEGMTHYQG